MLHAVQLSSKHVVRTIEDYNYHSMRLQVSWHDGQVFAFLIARADCTAVSQAVLLCKLAYVQMLHGIAKFCVFAHL
jgi:hypothetical protein